MKRTLLLPLAATAALLALSSCSSTVQSRIEKNPQIYAALSGSHQQAVREGQLKRGMSRDAVYLAWGRPNGIKEGSSNGRELEKWRYVSHHSVTHHHVGIGYGYGRSYYGRYGGYCGPFYDVGHTVEYIPYTSAVVEFQNGKVSAWERER